MTKVWISELEFNDGTKISLDKNEVVVFVGPNNAGKSATLKEASSLLKSKVNGKQSAKVLKDLTINKEGDEAAFNCFLESISTKKYLGNPEPHFQGFGFSIICESDSDCRFYSAILSSLFDGTSEINPDILFIPCGGKHKIPVVIKSLMKLNVPIKVVADFDVFNDINPLKSIYSELGGIWLTVEHDWQTVKSSIDQKRPELQTLELKKEIEDILVSVQDQLFPKDKIKQIQKSLTKASAWAYAKEVGKQFIPNGDPTLAFDRLQSHLKAVGLLVIEGGELEGFVKSIAKHGQKWVSEVLAKDLKKDPELEIARKFVLQLIE